MGGPATGGGRRDRAERGSPLNREATRCAISFFSDHRQYNVENGTYKYLHQLCRVGNIEAVRQLLHHKPETNVNEPDSNRRTPLHHLAWAEDEDKAKSILDLLKERAYLNFPDRDGETPLSLAYSKQRWFLTNQLERFGAVLPSAEKAKEVRDRIDRLLLDDGKCDQNDRPINAIYQELSPDRLPIYWIDTMLAQTNLHQIRWETASITPLPDNSSSNPTALQQAIMHNDIGYAQSLIMPGRADVNETDTQGQTALHYAAIYLHDPYDMEITGLLLRNRANINHMSEDMDKTCLDHAYLHNKWRLASCLESQGAVLSTDSYSTVKNYVNDQLSDPGNITYCIAARACRDIRQKQMRLPQLVIEPLMRHTEIHRRLTQALPTAAPSP